MIPDRPVPDPQPARPPRAALIAVGSELLAEARPDTNGTRLAGELASLGIPTACRVIVGDDETAIARVVDSAVRDHEITLVTGGLGPTIDDVTREGICLAFGLELESDPSLSESLRRRYEARGRTFSDWAMRQAMLPRGAEPLRNRAGSAPGLWLEPLPGRRLILLPGVPHEMERIMQEEVMPRLRALAPPDSPLTRVLKVAGLTESEVQDAILDLFTPPEAGAPALTLLASPGEVTIVIRGTSPQLVAERAGSAELRLGASVFGSGLDAAIEAAAGRRLAALGRTLATAESCTGGLMAEMLTRVPGSSAWFRQGWVTYSNASKVEQLGVDPELLQTHGAVSPRVADAMSAGALARSGADAAVGITGIAGPDGGSLDKPVGLVYISVAGPRGCLATRHLFGGDREAIRLWAARSALDRIRREIS